MDIKNYTELNINQRINFKSGWDIAISYEGQKGIIPSKPYCKLARCMSAKGIPIDICKRDYNNEQHHRILNGGRVFVKQSF